MRPGSIGSLSEDRPRSLHGLVYAVEFSLNSGRLCVAKGRIVIDEARCKGCRLCVTVCPPEILVISSRLNERGHSPAEVTDMDLCTGCGMCAVICPDVCITVYRQVARRRKSVPAVAR